LPTVEELAAQWDLAPRSNVGIVLGRVSGLIGIDVDGPDGERLLQVASGKEGTPGTLAFRTGRGFRLLYSLEAGLTIRSWSLRRDRSEMKVLGEGSLTVMPPSLHLSGKRYSWFLGRRKVTMMPEWVRRPGGHKTRSRRDNLVTIGKVIPEGQRNETLFRVACAMRGRGRTEEEILAEISTINRRCVPPLSPIEVMTIAQSAARYPMEDRI
jgi:hypothetical protein